jgi:hypothetical protein
LLRSLLEVIRPPRGLRALPRRMSRTTTYVRDVTTIRRVALIQRL